MESEFYCPKRLLIDFNICVVFKYRIPFLLEELPDQQMQDLNSHYQFLDGQNPWYLQVLVVIVELSVTLELES